MRGLPSMAGRVWMNGGVNAARITERCVPTGPDQEARWPRQKSPRWSAGGRACRSHGRRHPERCQTKTLRLTGAPLPLWREKEMKAAPRALLCQGPMSRVCIGDADVMRLKSAGCLTCESENTPARAACSAVIPGRAERREPGIQFRRDFLMRLDSGLAIKSASTRVFDALWWRPRMTA